MIKFSFYTPYNKQASIFIEASVSLVYLEHYHRGFYLHTSLLSGRGWQYNTAAGPHCGWDNAVKISLRPGGSVAICKRNRKVLPPSVL